MDGFIESWIECSPNHLDKFVNFLKFMDYSDVIWESSHFDKSSSISNIIEKYETQDQLNVYSRKSLTATSKHQSKGQLEHLRHQNLIISQLCTNPNLTKWACLDQRIDFLVFHSSEIHLLVDDSTARMLNENEKFIEINCREIYDNQGKIPIGLLRNIRKTIIRCIKKRVPILLSTKARNLTELRSPQSILGLADFLGIKEDYYREISQKLLSERIQRNYDRLHSNGAFIAPGIWKKPQ